MWLYFIYLCYACCTVHVCVCGWTPHSSISAQAQAQSDFIPFNEGNLIRKAQHFHFHFHFDIFAH